MSSLSGLMINGRSGLVKLIITESVTESGTPKVIFKATLQEAGVVNQNKRRYSSAICESIVDQLSPKATSRNLLMEVDHPMSGTEEEMKRRAGIVKLSECGCILREIKMEPNGKVVGIIETLSGFKGPDIARLITEDKVDIGFSLRALGGVTPTGDGILEVTSPIRAITYDIVSNPSHKNAKILQFIPESDTSYMTESANSNTMLFESADFNADRLILESDNVNLPLFENFSLDFLDKVIRKDFTKNICGMTFKF